MWAFRKGSTFWATFLGVFGALYLTLGLCEQVLVDAVYDSLDTVRGALGVMRDDA